MKHVLVMFVASLLCCISYLTFVIVIIKYHQFTIHSEHTIMSKYARFRIHIAPLGFETDRVVLPAVEMKADKVWILIHNVPKETEAISYLKEIKTRLRKEKIDFETKEVDRLDLFSTIKGVKEITADKKHTYYVNVSTGSKIQAVACTMACMMFNENNNLIPFYVQPENYLELEGKQYSYGMKEIFDLPKYAIKTPEKKLIKSLQLIAQAKKGRITKKELAELAEQEKLIEIGAKEKNRDQARYASLQKNIIEPLRDNWKFVTEDKVGRTRWIEITDEGKNVMEVMCENEISL